MYVCVHEKQKGMVPEARTAGSCFGLVRPRQCSVGLGGPATSTVDIRHQKGLISVDILKSL